MHLLLNKFVGLLEQGTGIYETLLSVLQREKKAIIDSNFKDSNEAGKQKENLVLKIRILEEERLRVQERLADSLGYQPEDLTVTKLSQLVEEPYSTRLESCRSNLLALLQSIQEVNNSNKALIMHSLELVRGSLNLLGNLISDNPVYYRSGRVQMGDQTGKVLCGEI